MFKTKRGSINIENAIEYLINNINIESNGNFGKNVDHSLLIWGFLFKRQKYDYIYHSNCIKYNRICWNWKTIKLS